eukprot:6203921-Pleurochrysis_carterae.AAC.2
MRTQRMHSYAFLLPTTYAHASDTSARTARARIGASLAPACTVATMYTHCKRVCALRMCTRRMCARHVRAATSADAHMRAYAARARAAMKRIRA